MTERAPETTREWMEGRFDRLDDKIGKQLDDLHTEIVTTRHGQKEVSEQLARQIVMLTQMVNAHEGQLGAINEWRADGGPLDSRFHRHSERHDRAEAWRNRMIGGLALVAVLFPATLAAVVAVVVNSR